MESKEKRREREREREGYELWSFWVGAVCAFSRLFVGGARSTASLFLMTRNTRRHCSSLFKKEDEYKRHGSKLLWEMTTDGCPSPWKKEKETESFDVPCDRSATTTTIDRKSPPNMSCYFPLCLPLHNSLPGKGEFFFSFIIYILTIETQSLSSDLTGPWNAHVSEFSCILWKKCRIRKRKWESNFALGLRGVCLGEKKYRTGRFPPLIALMFFLEEEEEKK